MPGSTSGLSERGNKWVTPVAPPELGKLWCVHAQRGCYEWLVHPDDGQQLLDAGVVLDGVRCLVKKIGEWPHVGRWHMQVNVPEANRAWIDAAAA